MRCISSTTSLRISEPHSILQPQLGEHLHGFQTQADDAPEQVDDVAGLAVLVAPEVGVVDDAALLERRHLVPLHDPLDRGLAFDPVRILVMEGVLVRRYPRPKPWVSGTLRQNALFLRRRHWFEIFRQPDLFVVGTVEGKPVFAFSHYYQSIILTPHFLQNKNKSVSFA